MATGVVQGMWSTPSEPNISDSPEVDNSTYFQLNKIGAKL